MKLSILIPSINIRAAMLDRLLEQIKKQLKLIQVCDVLTIPLSSSSSNFYRLMFDKNVEVLVLKDSCQNTIGEKRNKLVSLAEGEYCAFIDDDDRIAENYFENILDCLKFEPDCCSLKGIYTENGSTPKPFIHSTHFNSWFEDNGVFYRYPNHLNTIKTAIVKQIPFLEINREEDKDFSIRLMESGLIGNQIIIEYVLYYYDYISNK